MTSLEKRLVRYQVPRLLMCDASRPPVASDAASARTPRAASPRARSPGSCAASARCTTARRRRRPGRPHVRRAAAAPPPAARLPRPDPPLDLPARLRVLHPPVDVGDADPAVPRELPQATVEGPDGLERPLRELRPVGREARRCAGGGGGAPGGGAPLSTGGSRPPPPPPPPPPPLLLPRFVRHPSRLLQHPPDAVVGYVGSAVPLDRPLERHGVESLLVLRLPDERPLLLGHRPGRTSDAGHAR